MRGVREPGLADGRLTGGLLAAFTAAAAACGAGAANAATFIDTPLVTPVSFDLANPGGTPTLDLDIGGSTVSVYGTPGDYVIDLDAGSGLTLTLEDHAASFASPGSIPAYSASLKTATGVTPVVDTLGSTVFSNLDSQGYIGMYLGGDHTPAYLSYLNSVTTDTNNVQDDVFTVTGFGIATPEPDTWALLVLGVGGVGAALRRRRSMTAAVAA